MGTNDRAEDWGPGGYTPLTLAAHGDGFPLWTSDGTKPNTDVMTSSERTWEKELMTSSSS